MTNILLLLSSPRGEASYSTRAARALVEELRARHPGTTVTVRDLAQNPLPHIDEAFVGGMGTPEEARSEAQKAAIARSDGLIDELLAADIVVIASAMINFGLSSTLKTWIDHVARAGMTFRYTAEGAPEGLAGGRKVYIVPARGGVYSEGPMQAAEFQERYLRHMLGFLGMTDIEVIAIEGTALGQEVAEKAYAGALARIPAVAGAAA